MTTEKKETIFKSVSITIFISTYLIIGYNIWWDDEISGIIEKILFPLMGSFLFLIHPYLLARRLIFGRIKGFEDSDFKMLLPFSLLALIVSVFNKDFSLYNFANFFIDNFLGEHSFVLFSIEIEKKILYYFSIILMTMFINKFYINNFLLKKDIDTPNEITHSANFENVNETKKTIFISVITTILLTLALIIFIKFDQELDRYYILTKISITALSAAIITFLPGIIAYRIFIDSIKFDEEKIAYDLAIILTVSYSYYFILNLIQKYLLNLTSYIFEIIKEEFNHFEWMLFLLLWAILLISVTVISIRWLYKSKK